MTDQRRDERPYGQVLDAYLAHGGRLQPVVAGIALEPGERCFGIGSGKLVRQDAAGVWQPVERGLIHITDRRIVVEGTAERREVPLASIASVAETALLVEIEAGGDRWGLVLPYPDYWRVLVERVLQARVVDGSA